MTTKKQIPTMKKTFGEEQNKDGEKREKKRQMIASISAAESSIPRPE